MRGVFGTSLLGLLGAALCAVVGCARTPISSVEGPLTPYSPALNAATNSEQGKENSIVSGTSTPPYRYNPADVDARLLDDREAPPTFWENLQEKTAPKRMAAGFQRLIGRGPDEEYARHNYNEADLYFREKRYKEAAKRYKIAAARWPDSAMQEDALFMLGECYFQLDRYPKASNSYTKLVKKYENSRHLDMVVKRRFAIGRYWEQRSKDDPASTFNFTDKSMTFWDTVGNTVAIYESIRMDDPTGPLADDATMATANVLFLNGRWEDAGYHYDLMRTEFPQSEFQPQAHLLGMQAKLRSYQGPHYDPKPLLDARKLARTIQAQYLAQLPNERENIQQAQKAIEAQLAERDWSLGEFYYNTKHYAAAKYYYSEVVKEYPQSRFADLAKERIDAVKDKPPDVQNEIEWIASKFKRAPAAPQSAPAESPASGAPDQPVMAGAPAPPSGTGSPGAPSSVTR